MCFGCCKLEWLWFLGSLLTHLPKGPRPGDKRFKLLRPWAKAGKQKAKRLTRFGQLGACPEASLPCWASDGLRDFLRIGTAQVFGGHRHRRFQAQHLPRVSAGAAWLAPRGVVVGGWCHLGMRQNRGTNVSKVIFLLAVLGTTQGYSGQSTHSTPRVMPLVSMNSSGSMSSIHPQFTY